MSPDGARNQEQLLWRGPKTICCFTLCTDALSFFFSIFFSPFITPFLLRRLHFNLLIRLSLLLLLTFPFILVFVHFTLHSLLFLHLSSSHLLCLLLWHEQQNCLSRTSVGYRESCGEKCGGVD
jgi:hypothetical protein